jgi:hypothetical protein
MWNRCGVNGCTAGIGIYLYQYRSIRSRTARRASAHPPVEIPDRVGVMDEEQLVDGCEFDGGSLRTRKSTL